jgi:hypothetical protein
MTSTSSSSQSRTTPCSARNRKAASVDAGYVEWYAGIDPRGVVHVLRFYTPAVSMSARGGTWSPPRCVYTDRVETDGKE